jgi:hypothetical protein
VQSRGDRNAGSLESELTDAVTTFTGSATNGILIATTFHYDIRHPRETELSDAVSIDGLSDCHSSINHHDAGDG